MDVVTPGASAPEPAQSTSRLPRAVLLLLGAAGAVVAGAGIRAASGVVGPILVAVVLTVALAPVGYWARRKGWPGWAATLLAMVAAYAVVLFLVVTVAFSLVRLAELLPSYLPRSEELSKELTDKLGSLGLAKGPTSTSVDQLDLSKVTNLVTELLSSLLGILGNLFFLVTLLFFMTADAVLVAAGISGLKGSKPEMAASLERFAFATRRYLVMASIFGGIVAVLDTGALWLMGIPLPLLWGLLAFVTNFIPNIGFVIGVIPPALIALLDQGWTAMLAVIVVYSVLNVVIQSFIQPRFVGDAVGLSPTVTFMSLAVWAFLLGPIGALLAVPMTLLVRALLIDPDPAAGWASMLIGSTQVVDDPEPEPPPSNQAEDSPAPMAGEPV